MARIKVQANGRLVRQGLENLKGDVPRIGRLRLFHAMTRVLQRLKKPGKKPRNPIPWDSIRQRRAFFASNGFGGGIPHRRTGDYQRGFRIRRIARGYELLNPSRAAPFVGGDARGNRRSRIHAGRWPLIRDEVDKEVKKLPSAVVQHLQIVARQRGFRTK
jgi:hypothetical protein